MKKYALLLLMLLSQALPSSAQAETDLDYFKQFLYLEENISDDPDFPQYQYRFLMAKMMEIDLPNGQTIAPDVVIYLLADGTYLMHYKEHRMLAKNPDGTRPFIPGRCHKFQGHWSVPAMQLVLDDVATGDRAFSDSRNMVGFKLTKDIENAGMAGREIILDYGYGNSGIEGPHYFCR